MTEFLNRKSTYPIQPLLLSRVSTRAFSQERLEEAELMSLFEAARWAPSSYNAQPWRIIYARRDEPEWDVLFNLLGEFNQSWCRYADTLLLFISRNRFEHNNQEAPTCHFDAGSAWMSLALEAHTRNIVAHGMQGFDYEKAKKDLQIPDIYTVEAMAAIGKPGNADLLPKDLQEREKPSERKPLFEILAKGKFCFN